ncbi:MAG TPA: glycoside hydrolase family 172 protein [Bryobacteraceae bacterium]|nr:glycoside hydrolase family 172 protein [Bryobacteraceae bacterium]
MHKQRALLLGMALLAAVGMRAEIAETWGVYRLDLLARYRSSVRVGMVSSYDRSGGNDDGFSGKYSFIRKEPGGLVLADLKGPGVVYRIWTPTPTDDVAEFYFDGESAPRIRTTVREIFLGTRFPFLSPVAGVGGGGFYAYAPLPFRTSFKLVVKAEKFQFYQVNYAIYPEAAGITTFEASETGAYASELKRAAELLGSAGGDITRWVAPAGAKIETHRAAKTLASGGSVTLFETSRPGRIVGLRLGPARALAGKDRATLLKIFWDGETEPSVVVPAGDLFGYGWGQPAVRSLLMGTSAGMNYLYLPMPFDRSARIELQSLDSSGQPLAVEAEVLTAPVPRDAGEGKLHAIWRRENPTRKGAAFTLLDVKGRGHVVGVVLQGQGFEPGDTSFFEGDDQATIDGELAAHGTGSEDFFNGGWYAVPGRWAGRVSLPLSGALDYSQALARTGGYRFLLGDAYPYRKSMRLTIEHGPTDNAVSTDYAAVTFFYTDSRPAPAPALTAQDRKVIDPERIVFSPGRDVPVYAMSWQNASVENKSETVGGKRVSFLAFKASGPDAFGPAYVAFLCEMPSAGRYNVSIDAVEGPSAATVQLFRDERATGQPVDLHSAERRVSGPRQLGVLDLSEGANPVFFKLVGKAGDFDLSRIIFERAR